MMKNSWKTILFCGCCRVAKFVAIDGLDIHLTALYEIRCYA